VPASFPKPLRKLKANSLIVILARPALPRHLILQGARNSRVGADDERGFRIADPNLVVARQLQAVAVELRALDDPDDVDAANRGVAPVSSICSRRPLVTLVMKMVAASVDVAVMLTSIQSPGAIGKSGRMKDLSGVHSNQTKCTFLPVASSTF
jgi:hypothetical protein